MRPSEIFAYKKPDNVRFGSMVLIKSATKRAALLSCAFVGRLLSAPVGERQHRSPD